MKLGLYIPYYGKQSYLEQMISSLQSQSDPNWTALVIDDCFPGSTACDYVESLGDSRIKCIRNAKNLGTSGTYNLCVSLCEADFIQILGFDDLLLKDHVATAKRSISLYPEAAIIQAGVQVIDEFGDRKIFIADKVKALIHRLISPDCLQRSSLRNSISLLLGNWTYFPAILWSTRAVRMRGFRSDLSLCQDFEMLINLTLAGEPIARLSSQTFQYRRHSASASGKPNQRLEWVAQEAKVFLELRQELIKRKRFLLALLAMLRPASRLAAITYGLGFAIKGHLRTSMQIFGYGFRL